MAGNSPMLSAPSRTEESTLTLVTKTHPSLTKRLLYSRKESAAILGISLRKLDLLLAAGAIKPVRIDGRTLISERVLAVFAVTGTDTPSAA